MNPRIAKLVEAARAKHAAAQTLRAEQEAQKLQAAEATQPEALPQGLALSEIAAAATPQVPGRLIFNAEQQQAIELALQGKNFCLIGPAGSGKTTVTQEIISLLQRASHVRPFSGDTKHIVRGTPGIVILGYTNKAVNNIKKKLTEALQAHCITMHKCVEYAPVYYEVLDDKGNYRTTMRFEPSYHRSNKLPHISTCILEESSMIGIDLFDKLHQALPNPQGSQTIFLGDLNQLPPIFGPSILGFRLSELPVVELTQIYRQALLSPIISLATDIRTNSFERCPEATTLGKDKIIIDRGEHGKVTIHPWKNRIDKDYALQTMHTFLPASIDGNVYDPTEDIILCPFNKSFGTIELNKIIANHLARKRDATVYEVIARYQRSHWAVGDRVLVDRHEAVIEKISHAVGYSGPLPQDESKTLDYWGHDSATAAPTSEDLLTSGDPFDKLDALAATIGTGSEDEEAKNMASHFIDVFIPDLGITKTLTTAGEINSMLHGYAITVHKSQGSEWRRVFLLLHNSHSTMLSRELVYTAVTRAKQELYIVCEADTLRKGTTPARKNSIVAAASRPVIPGTTLPEKIAFFRKKAEELAQRASNQQSTDEGE